MTGQAEVLADWASQRGFEVVKVYTEEESATGRTIIYRFKRLGILISFISKSGPSPVSPNHSFHLNTC